MEDEDYYAMIELASSLSFVEAAKFIRSESGLSMMESLRAVEAMVVGRHPNSVCANSVRARIAK